MTASFLELGPKNACRGRPASPMSVRSLASARLMELWAHSVDLLTMRWASTPWSRSASRPRCSCPGRPSEHVQRERARVRSRDPHVPGADASVGRAVDEGRAERSRTTSRARRRTGRSWPSVVATGWTLASKWSATKRAPTRASCRPSRPRRSAPQSEEPALVVPENRPEGATPSGRYR